MTKPLTLALDNVMEHDLFTYPQIMGDRDGETFHRPRDLVRLNDQCQRVYDAVRDGKWHTLREISELTGDPEASVSARLRDLRKPKFGDYPIEREYVQRGLWRYRIGGAA